MSDQTDRWKQKLADWQSQEGKASQWKPVRGENRIRIIPAFQKGGDFFKEFYTAFQVGPNRRALIPRNQYGLDCEFTKYFDTLAARGDQASKDEMERIKPNLQVAVFIIDRNDEAKGTQVWYASQKQMREVMKYVVDPRYGDITLPEPDADGRGSRDLVINYTPKEQTKTKRFAEYEIKADAFTSPLGKPEQVKKWLAEDLFEKFRIGTPSDPEWIAAVLAGTDKEYSQAAAERGGEAPTPPSDIPSDEPAAVSPPSPYPDGFTEETLVYIVGPDKQAVQVKASLVLSKVLAGENPQVHLDGIWKKAQDWGFKQAPAPPPVDAPPAVPSSPPLPPSEDEAIQAQIEELQRKRAQSSTAASELRNALN